MGKIIGHEKIIGDLARAADRGTLRHAYLFFGTGNVGKCTVGQGLMHHLEGGPFEPRDAVLNDGLFVAPEADGSIGIEVARAVRFFLFQRPNVSRRRTVLIERAEALTLEAENALLKVAEEPPSSGLIILVAPSEESLAPTLASRLAKLYFGAVPESAVLAWLTKEHGVSSTVAREAARASRGKPGLALAFAKDKQFQAQGKLAREFLKLRSGERRAFVKSMLEKKGFSPDAFLEAVLVALAREAKIPAERWHRVAALRAEMSRFNLNPRLQLETLLVAP